MHISYMYIQMLTHSKPLLHKLTNNLCISHILKLSYILNPLHTDWPTFNCLYFIYSSSHTFKTSCKLTHTLCMSHILKCSYIWNGFQTNRPISCAYIIYLSAHTFKLSSVQTSLYLVHRSYIQILTHKNYTNWSIRCAYLLYICSQMQNLLYMTDL